jgi:hypothetical protein
MWTILRFCQGRLCASFECALLHDASGSANRAVCRIDAGIFVNRVSGTVLEGSHLRKPVENTSYDKSTNGQIHSRPEHARNRRGNRRCGTKIFAKPLIETDPIHERDRPSVRCGSDTTTARVPVSVPVRVYPLASGCRALNNFGTELSARPIRHAVAADFGGRRTRARPKRSQPTYLHQCRRSRRS